ncbi:hypothetical protein TEQG_02368 [Trichophyton equinum CBS 127.97]|uniref:Uncharacterized protein n=1 Tax=Trichophyton equinum (strain ATCC MYA-4606 / CBS 127.97) TaxID=559882 RepID=F2PN67_TRIEC|nr:hypothetical protein TEQG_02368 [Trichophyton equinum CBS 127.97]
MGPARTTKMDVVLLSKAAPDWADESFYINQVLEGPVDAYRCTNSSKGAIVYPVFCTAKINSAQSVTFLDSGQAYKIESYAGIIKAIGELNYLWFLQAIVGLF